MDNIRQSRINNLNYFLTGKELITASGSAITFFDSIITENGILGKILIDQLKSGTYQILFVNKLTLLLTSTSDFKFSSPNDILLNSIAIEGIDTESIIGLTCNLTITNQ